MPLHSPHKGLGEVSAVEKVGLVLCQDQLLVVVYLFPSSHLIYFFPSSHLTIHHSTLSTIQSLHLHLYLLQPPCVSTVVPND